MKRFFLAIALLGTFLTIQAQQAESVFLRKNVYDWYQSEVNDFKNAYNLVSNGKLEQQEMKEHVLTLETAVRLFDDNSIKIYNKMLEPFDYQRTSWARNTIWDGAADEISVFEYRNNEKRADNSYVELKMTRADLDRFLDNAAVIKEVRDQIESTRGFWAEVKKNTKRYGNAEKLSQVAEYAEANKALLTSKRVN